MTPLPDGRHLVSGVYVRQHPFFAKGPWSAAYSEPPAVFASRQSFVADWLPRFPEFFLEDCRGALGKTGSDAEGV